MFDKIVMADNIIKLVRFVITYEETYGNTDLIQREEWALNEQEKDSIVARLNSQNIESIINNVIIPPEIEQYDGMEWHEGRDKALLMINNDPMVKIEQLKKQLVDMDYKTSKYADGEYAQEEWSQIVMERKNIRVKIRELESSIEGG